MFRVLPVTEPVATLDDYLAIGGGAGILAALDHGPGSVLGQVRKAGLRGRAGAGLPVAAKWSAVRDGTRYVVGNATEGEPGTFKDRHLLRRNPYQVLEGLAIAAMCVGASRAFVVIKRRFEQEIVALITAAAQLRAAGLLGEVPLQLVFHPDACQGRATLVHNVETLAHVPEILRLGADGFRETGTESSPGTMVFTVSGDVRRHGTAELPLGFPLRALIEVVGGGVAPGRRVKAVFCGACGAPLGEDQLDTPLDFDSMQAAGSRLGSAGLVVYDDTACVVAAALGFSECLAGPDAVTRCLRRIECGNGSARDLDTILAECSTVTSSRRSALRRRAAAVVGGTLARFRAEFEAHLGRVCPLPRELPVPKFVDFDEAGGRFHYDERYRFRAFDDEPGLSA